MDDRLDKLIPLFPLDHQVEFGFGGSDTACVNAFHILFPVAVVVQSPDQLPEIRHHQRQAFPHWLPPDLKRPGHVGQSDPISRTAFFFFGMGFLRDLREGLDQGVSLPSDQMVCKCADRGVFEKEVAIHVQAVPLGDPFRKAHQSDRIEIVFSEIGLRVQLIHSNLKNVGGDAEQVFPKALGETSAIGFVG